MSKAGIQSNRGDGYQTLVAFDWALTILSDPDFQWVEVDSVTCSVDDIVIGKVDGTIICCQCKKNQTQHKSWSIADLGDELIKAINLLSNNSKAEVRFYSRSAFGDLAALREYSANYADESTYQSNLTQAHKKTDTNLAQLLSEQASSLSTYQVLQRTKFEVSPELDRMETLLRERLRHLVSNHSQTYNVLWVRLNQLAMRESGDSQNSALQHRLTKDDLKTLLDNAGSILTPPMDIEEIRTSFKNTSAIGRSWRRDVGNEYISSPVVSEVIEAIEAKQRSILLTGLPGSGKTCVILDVQDELERIAQTRSDLFPLFIQSREFADIVTVKDRQAQGLPEHWVEKVARMAEDAHVVVMIDSLDVLSIAREHRVLMYFLAQIDRLLVIPNVTVVTACRDFDRHYERRIAERSWDKEITCQLLDWDTQIAPLLTRFHIDLLPIDETTRELIRNPRELALFVELAQQGGSFNVVTSQALAKRYLVTIVQSNSSLGDAAMQAIEAIASEMLRLRSLVVPHQRFIASQEIKRALLSNKVLHETQDGQLTFGHQTLLDVLVISGALRQAVTLNEFTQQLPPVPFVRPSIRSFVAQLAIGDRREFRKQLRTVLTGNSAFHIRRLIAETFAEYAPQDDDWLLLRDLHNQHREVFQVIYTQARRVEWHHFWMKNLVPALKDTCDADGLTMHAHRVSQWKDDDAEGVLAFWTEILTLEGVDQSSLADSVVRSIKEISEEHLALCVPLLVELLKLPRQKYSFLGHALARCVKNGYMDDAALWGYIAGDVGEKEVLAFRFDKKLHCQPHEFGNSNDNFFVHRMLQSTTLLDLAIASIERWSQIKISRYGEVPYSSYSGFLSETSYKDAHSQRDRPRHVDAERNLLDAVEAAIKHHANIQSHWWQSNRTRLCFSTEGSLRYFAILACTEAPTTNLDVIDHMLCDKALLTSDLSYELGTLIQTSFLHFDAATQDSIQATILTLHEEDTTDPLHRIWILKKQAQLLITIPCHLRSVDAQVVLSECEKEIWPLVRQPHIGQQGGIVHAPFSFEVFLNTSNDGVLRLLDHYDGHEGNSFYDFLVGGEREVGRQLSEAASRHPSRYLNLLSEKWERIPDCFQDDLMEGVATYLAHRYGNLRPNGDWTPKEEPPAAELAQKILDELERHPSHWRHNRAASKAIESCAHVVVKAEDAVRLVSFATKFSTFQEESSITGDSTDLITAGINMAKGNAAEALMILANQLEENDVPWPESLPNSLGLFAADEQPAIRALMLRRIPYLQSNYPELSWKLFSLAMQESAPGLWEVAEPCLYYAYHHKFEVVHPWLVQLYQEGRGKDLETWGRISALAALSRQMDFSTLIAELNIVNSTEAWNGAASVWTNSGNAQQHREQCLSGLEAGLNASNKHAASVAHKLLNIFQEVTPLVEVPIESIRRCFDLLEIEADSSQRDIYGFDAWLNATSLRNPNYALDAAEIYLGFIQRTKPYLYDHENNLTQLLTRLFAQAEEQEESDSGTMLQRVVTMQDVLLALGANGVQDWLKAAERP